MKFEIDPDKSGRERKENGKATIAHLDQKGNISELEYEEMR